MSIEHELKKPFPEGAIHWRIGARNKDKSKGLPLAYIDARDVMDRLDFIFGINGWQDRYFETSSGRVICELTCYHKEWECKVTKSDGAGDTGTEGEKGAISDALKRAAVKFGIGRYLYGLGGQWVDLDQYGKFTAPSLPQWATPNGYGRITASEKREVYGQVVGCLETGDGAGLREVWDEYDNDEKVQLWGLFTSTQRKTFGALLDDSKIVEA